jgi:hypothetical protein
VLAMTCKGCESDKQSVFNGEIGIHFPGLQGLKNHTVFVFPKLVVCLHCGFTEFTVPERELQALTQGSPVKGAVIFSEEGGRSSERVGTKSISAEMND